LITNKIRISQPTRTVIKIVITKPISTAMILINLSNLTALSVILPNCHPIPNTQNLLTDLP